MMMTSWVTSGSETHPYGPCLYFAREQSHSITSLNEFYMQLKWKCIVGHGVRTKHTPRAFPRACVRAHVFPWALKISSLSAWWHGHIAGALDQGNVFISVGLLARCQLVLSYLEERGELSSPAAPAHQRPEHFSAFQVNFEDVNWHHQHRKGQGIWLRSH